MLANAAQERAIIYTTERTSSMLGQTAADWIVHSVCWCIVAPVSIANQAELDQLGHSDVRVKLVIRGEVILQIDRTKIVVRGRTYTIVAHGDYDMRKRQTTFYVRELVSGEAQ